MYQKKKSKKIIKNTYRKKLEKKLDKLIRDICLLNYPTCFCCGSMENLQCGHLITRAKKNTRWNLDNVRTQCASCNLKHEYYPEIFTKLWIEENGINKYNKLIELSWSKKKMTVNEMEEIFNLLNKNTGKTK